ncbi:MAG: hypothetical protein IIB27_09050 [Chloroflexi bacterium]|nr:hypothetical protein [Chloroflexota bacterium]
MPHGPAGGFCEESASRRLAFAGKPTPGNSSIAPATGPNRIDRTVAIALVARECIDSTLARTDGSRPASAASTCPRRCAGQTRSNASEDAPDIAAAAGMSRIIGRPRTARAPDRSVPGICPPPASVLARRS